MSESIRGRYQQLVHAFVVLFVLALLSASTVAEDGSPELDSKEYKILLRVDRFSNQPRGVREFWSGVVAVAREVSVPVHGSMTKRKERLVCFLDTKEFDLRQEFGYVFRIRTPLESDGTKKKRKKITLKYRGRNIEAASSVNVSSTAGKKKRRVEKLEEDIVPPHVSRFSHSGSAELKNTRQFKSIRNLADAFPGLKHLPIQDEKVRVVNGFRAHEVKIEGARITLNGDHAAEASFTFWHDRKLDGCLLAAEFSYTYEAGRQVPAMVEQNADRLFAEIQTQLEEWVDQNSRTKTQMVYGWSHTH